MGKRFASLSPLEEPKYSIEQMAANCAKSRDNNSVVLEFDPILLFPIRSDMFCGLLVLPYCYLGINDFSILHKQVYI